MSLTWESSKTNEYIHGELARTIMLYSLNHKNQHQNQDDGLLVRFDINAESVRNNKGMQIEILEEILPYQFKTRKRNGIEKIKDLCAHLETKILQRKIPQSMKDNMILEYKNTENKISEHENNGSSQT